MLLGAVHRSLRAQIRQHWLLMVLVLPDPIVLENVQQQYEKYTDNE